MDSDHFYSNLPLNDMPVSHLVANEQFFFTAPEDWHIVITDIKGSTRAVKDGWHQAVNLVAAGSIIAALNLAKKAETSIPFFFGGDGATLLAPPSLLGPIMGALHVHRENTLRNFGLELRVGHVPVAQAYQDGQRLLIAKARLEEAFDIPLVLGNALKYAERIVKGEGFNPFKPAGETPLDLEGMECRWNAVKPPKNLDEVVCLLAEARDEARHGAVFQKVLAAIDAIYGPKPRRNPISEPMLRLQATLGKINTEMRAKLGRFNLAYLLVNFLFTLFGFIYFRYYKNGRLYLQKLAERSDTLVVDGRINTVISGTRTQRQQLTAVLEQMEKAGELFYGLHACPESIMSCYVRDRHNLHIHFVDGAGGGYTKAAGVLKGKVRGETG